MSAFGRPQQSAVDACATSVPAGHEEPTHHRLRNPAGDLLVSLDFQTLTGTLIVADGTPDEEIEAAFSMLRDEIEHGRPEFVTAATTNIQAGVTRPPETPSHKVAAWLRELRRDLSATRDGRTPVEDLSQQSSDWGGA